VGYKGEKGARDLCISSTLVGGKGGAGRSSLRTPLEGHTERVYCEMERKSLRGINWIVFHGRLKCF
jgi:hypothetical protein